MNNVEVVTEYDRASAELARASAAFNAARTLLLTVVQGTPSTTTRNNNRTTRDVVLGYGPNRKFTAADIRQALPKAAASSIYAALQYLLDGKVIKRTSPGNYVKLAVKAS